jgi:urea carboxylase-associated protein 1
VSDAPAGAPPVAGRVVEDCVVGAGRPWSRVVRRGERLRIVDLEGGQGVDFLCYGWPDTAERYHAANTLKKAATLRLTAGHALYSDAGRAMFAILADSHGLNDTIAGCCSAASNALLYGVEGVPGCRENFLAELARHGLGRRDIVANVNFFCDVPVGPDGRLDPLTFRPATSRPGDYVELRAEMDALAVISNCPQVNNPCAAGKPTPIRVVVWGGHLERAQDPMLPSTAG